MKKLFTIALVLVLSLMVVGSAFANEEVPVYPIVSSQLDCGVVKLKMKNDSGVVVYGQGRVKANGVVVSTSPPGSSWKLVEPGGTIQARWVPPYDFAGDVEATVKFKRDGEIIARNDIRGSLGPCYTACDDIKSTVTVDKGPWSDCEWSARHVSNIRTRLVVTTTTYVDAHNPKISCGETVVEEEMEIEACDPFAVTVGVSLRCSTPDSEGTIWQLIAGVTVDPEDGATLTFDDVEYTSSQSFHTAFGTYEWSAEASEGYDILGDDQGTITITESDCNVPGAPPVHLMTGPSGQPINLPLVILMGLIGVSALSAGAVVVKRSRL